METIGDIILFIGLVLFGWAIFCIIVWYGKGALMLLEYFIKLINKQLKKPISRVWGGPEDENDEGFIVVPVFLLGGLVIIVLSSLFY